MNRSQLRIVLVVIAVAVAAMVVLLVTGGTDTTGVANAPADEGSGDVVVGAGEGAPEDVSLADIQEAEVTVSGEDEFVFSATFGGTVPKKLEKGQTFSFRWDVTGSDGTGFIVSGNLDVGANVSIVATQGRYGASSFDKTLPGELQIDGSTWTVTIDGSKIEGWPADFTWKLSTTLDGVQGDPASATVEDSAPNEGFGSITRA